jgi:copper(I)-binding protein
MLRLPISAAFALCLLTAGCNNAKYEEAGVEDVWIRLPAVPGRPGAAYFTFRGGNDPLTLESLSSPQVSSIELHETMTMAGGMSRMAPLKSIEIPAKGVIEFAPGGRHAMLFGVDPKLKPGDKIQIVFKLSPPVEIVTEAEVRGAGPGNETH